MIRKVLFLLFLLIAPVHASETESFNIKKFGMLPVLHEGRVKPMDSFARALKKTFAGHDDEALIWLMTSVFDPARGEHIPILRIHNPELVSLLKLEPRESKLYTYNEISEALKPKQQMVLKIAQSDEDDWSLQQKQLITLQQNFVTLRDLLTSLTAFTPIGVALADPLPERLSEFDLEYYSVYEVRLIKPVLENYIAGLLQAKEDDIDSYTEEEQSIITFSYTLDTLTKVARDTNLFKVIDEPNAVGVKHGPWHVLREGDIAALQIREMDAWQKIVKAYHNGDTKAWNVALNQLSPKQIDTRIWLEYHYNQYNPFVYSFIFCLLGCALLTLYSFVPKWQSWHAVSTLLSLATLIQLSGVVARIFILDRPPVSTLYETILFVTLIILMYAVYMFWQNKDRLSWAWIGFGVSIILHITGFSHDLDGDNFVMLTAVLNTNFWLTTHVLTITIGYAFCVMTSALAHITLGGKYLNPNFQSQNLYSAVITTSIIALFFSTIGTVLGGIWADQSWGRFWGWDPKENGALLIVLWLVWTLHGRISGQMNQTNVLLASAYLSVIVALSWFGVNILSIGLHAYGFTDAALWWLIGIIVFETLFVGLMYVALRKRTNV